MGQTCAVTKCGFTCPSTAQELGEKSGRIPPPPKPVLFHCRNCSSIVGLWACRDCFVECARAKVSLCSFENTLTI